MIDSILLLVACLCLILCLWRIRKLENEKVYWKEESNRWYSMWKREWEARKPEQKV